MERRSIRVSVAGQQYKVLSNAEDGDVLRLASTVDAKVAEVTPRGRSVTPQSMLLAAMSLAHELEEERAKRELLERRTRDVLQRALVRIDDALEVGRGESPEAE